MTIDAAIQGNQSLGSMSVTSSQPKVIYPSEDGEPLAETFLHLLAIITILQVLLRYLSGQEAMVLSDQFLYYVEGAKKTRCTGCDGDFWGALWSPR